MRIRTIKPEFWQHPVLARMSIPARLLALGCISMADDEGYFRADPIIIRSFIFPFDTEDSVNIHGALSECSLKGFIKLINHESQGPIGKVITFQKHQHINRPNPSKLKTYWDSVRTHGALSEDSVRTHGALSEDSLLDQGSGIREQGTGSRDQGASPQVLSAHSDQDPEPAAARSPSLKSEAKLEAADFCPGSPDPGTSDKAYIALQSLIPADERWGIDHRVTYPLFREACKRIGKEELLKRAEYYRAHVNVGKIDYPKSFRWWLVDRVWEEEWLSNRTIFVLAPWPWEKEAVAQNG